MYRHYANDLEYYKDRVAQQEVKIEQLTTENAELKKQIKDLNKSLDLFQDDIHYLQCDKAELQKQVDELKFDKELLQKLLEKREKQAVKDTAKEIFTAIVEEFVFSFKAKNEDYQNGYDQALTDYDNNLKKFFKERYGVEVE